MPGFLHFLVTDGLDCSVERHFQQYFSYIVAVSFIGGGNRRITPTCRKSLTYNTMIRTFCIMKKMTFTAFHYLNLSIRCEELDTHIN
jgi:hypothetical protein